MITAYLNVNAYAEFHRWLGRGPVLKPMWNAWAAGNCKGALAAIPDEVVDQLVVHGSDQGVPGPRAALYRQRGDDPRSDCHPCRDRTDRRRGRACSVTVQWSRKP
jgi:hypothetical protein